MLCWSFIFISLLAMRSTGFSLAAFECHHTRGDTGFADHRTLHVPTAMWNAAAADNLVWAKKLCCVYTWVVLDNNTEIAFMTTYDGSRKTYEDQTTMAEAAEGVYSAICGMYMGSSDCDTASHRCPANILQPTFAPARRKWSGSGAWTPGVREGQYNSCNTSLQSELRYECSSMLKTAQHICCHNTKYAEPRWYFENAVGPGGLFAHLDASGVTTFYDSSCGIPLYRAPVGRSVAAWHAESMEHGWPSFRRQETFMDNMVFRAGGEIESVCGTHLGHNLPDASGDRYCIDLICIAGSPRTPALAAEIAVPGHGAVGLLFLAAAALAVALPLMRVSRTALHESLVP